MEGTKTAETRPCVPNVATPLIQRHPTTGVFTLTLGVEKSTTLLPGSFTPFP